jgi:hypothetical protein
MINIMRRISSPILAVMDLSVPGWRQVRKMFCTSILMLAFSIVLTSCLSPTALSTAASAGRTEEVKALLDKGADINERPGACNSDAVTITGDGTALCCAAYYGRTATVKLLLDRGADVNTIHTGSASGLTALAFATREGHADTVKLLIDRGADIDKAIAALSWRSFGSPAVKFLNELKQERATHQLAVAKPSAEITFVPIAIKSDIDELPTIKMRQNKNAYAIVIGIENYRQKLPKADFATQDARLVADYLIKTMGYPEENVVMLLNDRASKSDLVKYFEKWLHNNVETGSTVFIYFSGHGAPNTKTGDAYLVPYDGDPSFIAETGYSLNKMYEALGKLQAKEIIVALDSCFSGAGGRSVIAKGARPLVINIQGNTALSQNMTVLSASSGEQISSTYDEKGHGLFTYFLLKGIKNEDFLKPDGSIKMEDLFDYIKPQVERIARRQYNNEQTPQLIGTRRQ